MSTKTFCDGCDKDITGTTPATVDIRDNLRMVYGRGPEVTFHWDLCDFCRLRVMNNMREILRHGHEAVK